MKQINIREKYGRVLFYFIFFMAVLFIMDQTPYCHDEWKWGSAERLELMRQGFPNYNGRYLGNLLALAITRSTAVKALVMAVGILWVLHTVENSLCEKTARGTARCRFLLLCAAALLLALPRTLYAQSYGWPAAFVNFVPPALFLLIYFNWTRALYDGSQNPSCTKLQAFLAIPLGLATQLFSEHTTLFAVLYAIWVLVFVTARKKKICAAYITYLISVMLGALVMFSNGAYRRAALSQTGYKKISLSLSAMYHQLADRILNPLFLDNWLLNALLAAVVILCIIRSRKKTVLNTLTALVLCGYSLYGIWHKVYPAWVFFGGSNLNHLAELGLTFLFFVCVLAGVWKHVSADRRLWTCVLYVSSALVAVPLVAANPIGSRCFYVSYLFQAVALLGILDDLVGTQAIDLYYPTWIAGLCAAVLCVIYLRMFSVIGAADRTRAGLIQTAVGQNADSVTLPVLPYSEYVWTTIPQDESWERYFKEFYGIPQEMEVHFQ